MTAGAGAQSTMIEIRKFRRRVAVAAVGVFVTSVASVTWMQRPGDDAPAGRPAIPRLLVSGARGGNTAAGETELMDPSPLFFPTVWNYGQATTGGGRRREPDEGFQDYLPRFRYSDQRLANYGREAVSVPERLSDVVEQGITFPFTGFGHVDFDLGPLAERGGYLEVKELGSGKLVREAELPSGALRLNDHLPIEILVTVGPAGIVGDPLFAAGSGSETVDAEVLDHLLRTYRLGERLGPGKYRVTVGP